MAQDVPPQPATYADLEAVPSHLIAEIIAGRLHTHPRPRPKHANTASVLGGTLVGSFQTGVNGPGGWWITDEPEVHLGDDIVVPDIVGWRRDRMPRLPDTSFYSISPDWVCEILSPSTESLDRSSKREIYAAHGVSHLWLIDPERRFIETFALTGGQWLLLATYCDDAKFAAPPFEAVPFALSLLWAD